MESDLEKRGSGFSTSARRFKSTELAHHADDRLRENRIHRKGALRVKILGSSSKIVQNDVRRSLFAVLSQFRTLTAMTIVQYTQYEEPRSDA